MAVYQPGDAPLVEYALTDPTTGAPVNATVTATLTDPTGAATGITVANPSTGLYRAVPNLSATGLWTLTWVATGTVQDTQTVTLYVTANGATPEAAPWAPTLGQVAAHIPTRTREVGIDNTYTGTFTAGTYPTADQVSTIIGHACAWAEGRAGTPIAAAAYPLLSAAAALRAAYWVELAYPERDADVSVYDRFRVDADEMAASAAQVNRAAGGGGSVDEEGRPDVLAAYQFPDPPRWADNTFIN